jgi:hypothetical protein
MDGNRVSTSLIYGEISENWKPGSEINTNLARQSSPDNDRISEKPRKRRQEKDFYRHKPSRLFLNSGETVDSRSYL